MLTFAKENLKHTYIKNHKRQNLQFFNILKQHITCFTNNNTDTMQPTCNEQTNDFE